MIGSGCLQRIGAELKATGATPGRWAVRCHRRWWPAWWQHDGGAGWRSRWSDRSDVRGGGGWAAGTGGGDGDRRRGACGRLGAGGGSWVGGWRRPGG
jgi:hypothetical protein